MLYRAFILGPIVPPFFVDIYKLKMVVERHQFLCPKKVFFPLQKWCSIIQFPLSVLCLQKTANFCKIFAKKPIVYKDVICIKPISHSLMIRILVSRYVEFTNLRIFKTFKNIHLNYFGSCDD